MFEYSQLISILTLAETDLKKTADFYKFRWSNEQLADIDEIGSQWTISRKGAILNAFLSPLEHF